AEPVRGIMNPTPTWNSPVIPPMPMPTLMWESRLVELGHRLGMAGLGHHDLVVPFELLRIGAGRREIADDATAEVRRQAAQDAILGVVGVAREVHLGDQ